MTTELLHLKQKSDTAVDVPIMMLNGQQKYVDLSLAAYAAAGNNGLTLSGYLELTNPGYDPKYGTVFEQVCMAAGVMIHSDSVTGLSSTTFKQLETGVHGLSQFPGMGSVVKPDGSLNNTVAGKLLVPEIILQVMRSNLSESKDDFFNGIDGMVALTENVAGDKVEQPLIDVTGPEASTSKRIAQLAEPAIMVSITTSQKTFRIPTVSIGAQISDQAQASSTLDLVSIAISAQARGERLRHYQDNLASMISGDVDTGETAVTSELITAYDATIAAANTITQKAYIKWLRSNYETRNINYLMMDIDTAIAVENRTGRPVVTGDNGTSGRLNVNESIMNMAVQAPNVLLLKNSVIGTGTIVGIDSRYAIRRVRNVSASYQAIEQNVIRRATSLRIDYGEMLHKLFGAAWQKVVLATS